MTCTFCACFNYFDNSGKLQEDTFLSFQGEVLSTIEQFANSSDGFDQLIKQDVHKQKNPLCSAALIGYKHPEKLIIIFFMHGKPYWILSLNLPWKPMVFSVRISNSGVFVIHFCMGSYK